MGLLAVSTISFSAIDMISPANETNVWNTGEVGNINIKGNFISTVPQVQYVVYSSMDGTYDETAGEFWQLSDWILSQDSSKNGFREINPKLYVKRVNGTKDNVDPLLESDVVYFKIELDPTVTQYNFNYFKTGMTRHIDPMALLATTTREALLSQINAGGVTGVVANINNWGLYGDSSGMTYKTPNVIKFNIVSNGILEIITIPNPDLRYGNIASNVISSIEAAYSIAQPITNVKVLVKIS